MFSPGGGLRSVVQIAHFAVMCALAFSAPTIRAQSNSASGSVGEKVLESCGVSDGDKAFGIEVVTDLMCGDGGLGCYNDHCRYCKVTDTLKSAHLESCESLGTSFPSMAPLTISTGSCGVSSGDAAVGVRGMTDPSCLYGGIGCFNDHCRFCRTESTSQSSQFVPCPWVEGQSSTLGSITDSDAGDASLAPIVVTSDAKMSESSIVASGSSDLEEEYATEAGSANVCSLTATDGDVAVGINITTDTSCVSGGTGCIDSVCRFCKATNTTQSAHLDACPVTVKVCTTTVSEGDAAVGIKIVTDTTCAQGGLGCIDNVCRFCRATATPQSASYVDCALLGGSASTTQAPTVTTPAPTTIAPAVTAAPATLAPTTAATKQTCTQIVSDGDAAVGINIVSDSSCANGGLGCLDQVCRFCRVTTTAQSASFADCASIEGTATTPAPTTTAAPTVTPAPSTAAPTKTPAPTTTAAPTVTPTPSTAAPTKTPAPTTTAAPTVTPAPSTAAPTKTTAPTVPVAITPAPTISAPTAICSITAAAGDAAAGINIVTDTSCAAGGLGCIDTMCRFCRLSTTTQSASYVDCATITATGTQAPTATTPTPTTTPSATSSTPSIVFECSRTVSSGDKGVGLDIVSDIRCSEGGTGCLDDVCRFCKRFDTIQSQTYLNCSSIPSADVGSDINFVPIPVVDDSETQTRRLASGSTTDSSESTDASYGTDNTDASADNTESSYESVEATSASTCAMTVSAGDAAVGINIVTDTSCSSGGTGCIDTVCRYCKTKDTTQAAHLNRCPSTAATTTGTSKVCMSTVTDGDAAVGINIITDVSCANGGLGCMDSVCRLCKTKSTDQSAHLGSCSDYSSIVSTPSATTTPATSSAAPTTAPVSTTFTYSIPLDCYQTASNGDKSLGLDIVADIRCGDGGVGCVDSTCRFCKRFETTQSHSYMNCSDIPSSDNGADINFKAIAFIEDTHESTSANTIVALHESTEFTSEVDDVCADVSLADGQAAGGIGVVLDTAHCPEGLASGCIGVAGCRYCMRFPTNISDYLEYCAIVNSTSVGYDLSGTGITLSTERSSTSLSGEASRVISAEERAPSSEVLEPHKSTTVYWSIGGVACVGAIAAVMLAGFGIKRTIGSPVGSDARSSDKEKVIPDDENRASVLITSNVGEPGVIRDV